MKRLLDFLLFQVVWFACVLGAAHGNGWVGPAAAGVFLVAELGLSSTPREDLRLFLRVAAVGVLADSLLHASGWLGYSAPNPWAPGWLVPAWIVALWFAFAALLRSSLRWLQGRTLLAFLFGAVGGPLSFLAGERLEAVTISEPRWLGLAALSIEWALLTPLALSWARRGVDGPVADGRSTAA